MAHETIDRQGAIDLFGQLMQHDSPFRFLRLLGEAKQGKSHLVNKVFPAIARETHRARCAALDVRSQARAAPDLLHTACSLLGGEGCFPAYHDAYRQWINRPRVEVTDLRAMLARVSVQAEGEEDESRKLARHLGACFATDLGRLDDAPLLLLFDGVEGADEPTRNWLLNVLLAQLSPLPHLRVVIAGRSLPAPCASYDALCRSYELRPVEDAEAYVAYCRETGIALAEQSIRDIAFALDYTPGLFVDLVAPKFGQETAGG